MGSDSGVGGNSDPGPGPGDTTTNGGLGPGANGLGDALGAISSGAWGGGPGTQGAMGENGENAVSSGGYGDAQGTGWGTNGFGVDALGNVTGPAGFDSPGFGESTASAQAAANGFEGPTFGGITQGGVLGTALSALNTALSLGFPAYGATIGTTLGLGNIGLGITNSLGVTNTGQLGPSLGEALGLSSPTTSTPMGDVTQGMPGYGAPSAPSAATTGMAEATGMVGTPGVGDAAPAAQAMGTAPGAAPGTQGGVPGQPSAGMNSRDAITQALLLQSPALASTAA